MRVLVAGATGVIGQHLVPDLIWAGAFKIWTEAFKSGTAA
jgi:nucleoside-diphosphate-sugar epimerase